MKFSILTLSTLLITQTILTEVRAANPSKNKIEKSQTENEEMKSLDREWINSCEIIKSIDNGLDHFHNWLIAKKEISKNDLEKIKTNFSGFKKIQKQFLIIYSTQYMRESTERMKLVIKERLRKSDAITK